LKRIHYQVDKIADALIRVFTQDFYVKKSIMITFKENKEWDDDLRKYFADTVYDITRNWRLLWYLIDKEITYSKEALYPLIEFYFSSLGKQDSYTLEGLFKEDVGLHERLINAQDVRVLRESIPDWLDDICSKEFNERWDGLLTALNKRPKTVIRTNTHKNSRDTLKMILRKEGIQAELIPYNPDAILIKDRINIFQLQSYKQGLFEVQNDASQMVSYFLDPHPGMRVIDVCAGEGGKSLHLSSLMQNKGKIIAMDTTEWKLIELRKRASKAGAENIETRHISSSKAYKRLKDTADRVLLDVPCSGLGTLRRNPDIKWKLTLEDLKRLEYLQHELLERYYPLVKQGGHLVYSVCSILSSEGEQQIRTFLDAHPSDFSLVKEKRYWPDTDDTDGFYMALLERL